MRKIGLAALFISIAIYSFGQNDFSIKIYQNTDFFEVQYNDWLAGKVTKVENVNFDRFSLALDIGRKSGYTHEIEFLIPELSKSLENIKFPMNYEFRKGETFDGKASSFSLRYELSKTLTNEDKRFAFLFGLGANPYYVHIEYEPNVETTYYVSTKLYGFVLNMIPRIKYKFSQRFNIDLNVPLKVYDLRRETSRIENPAIPIRQQTNSKNSHIFFEDAYTIRLGLTYKLNK